MNIDRKVHTLCVLLSLATVAACSQRQVKNVIYDTGMQADCVQANDNRPDSAQRQQACIQEQAAQPSYDEYEKQREELLKDDDSTSRD